MGVVKGEPPVPAPSASAAADLILNEPLLSNPAPSEESCAPLVFTPSFAAAADPGLALVPPAAFPLFAPFAPDEPPALVAAAAAALPPAPATPSPEAPDPCPAVQLAAPPRDAVKLIGSSWVPSG